MPIFGRSELIKLIERYKCVYPFDLQLMDGDGYVLTVRQEVGLHYLEHKNVVSHEVVFTPPNLVAHLTAKSKYGRMGLSFLNAAKVHSGFIGRLALELVNLSNDRAPIAIRRGDPLIHIEFIERVGEPSPYAGGYQFQYMNDEETKLYLELVTKEFPSIYPKKETEARAQSRVKLD
jgi:dCTP deaminase